MVAILEKETINKTTENVDYTTPASQRGIDMLLAKYRQQAFCTEVSTKSFEEIAAPNLKKALAKARIALATDGGLVPRGNPDNLNPTNARKFCMYSLCGSEALPEDEYEISHQGYNSEFAEADPNRLLPVDAMRRAEKEGRIGRLFDIFYTTAGVMTSVEDSIALGEKIAVSMRDCEIDAVLLVSTCGTSTRCGALIAKEIERVGIPVVQVTNLTKIAESVGARRILRGNDICHVFGNPALSLEEERAYRWEMILKALRLLEQRIPEESNSSIVIQ